MLVILHLPPMRYGYCYECNLLRALYCHIDINELEEWLLCLECSEKNEAKQTKE